MPNLSSLYNNERKKTSLDLSLGYTEGSWFRKEFFMKLVFLYTHWHIVLDLVFEVRVEKDLQQVYKSLHKHLTTYKDEKRGPTIVAIQSSFDFATLTAGIPALADFPTVPIHISDSETLYNVLDWQRVGAKCMISHFLKYNTYLQVKGWNLAGQF